MLVYLDACTLIYMIEGTEALADAILHIIDHQEVRLVTSCLSRLECRVRPLRLNDQQLLDRYERVFSAPDLALCDVTHEIIERATQLRARTGLRTPDAIHGATALACRADLFVTGDAALNRVPDLKIALISAPRAADDVPR